MLELVWATIFEPILNALHLEPKTLSDLAKRNEVKCKWSLRWWWQFELSTIFVFGSDWLKLKVILVHDVTPNSSKLHFPDHSEQSEGFMAGFAGFPSPSLLYYDPGLILTCWHIGQGWRLWCFLVLWLCLVPPYAKCRVCEDMQVARCLCNFPPAPFERQAWCNNNNKPVLLLKSNSAWPEFQRFFAWPKDPCYLAWARVRTAQMIWPLAQLTGWSSGSVTLHSSPGLREQVGGVLGMLWRIRILRDVLFFVNCSESGVCVYVYVCCLDVWVLLMSTWCDSLIVWWVDL